VPIIQPQPFEDFWVWLDANADELAKIAGVPQQQGIKNALREIAKAAGSDWNTVTKILVTVSGNKLLPFFTRNPTYFSEIAKIAQRHTNAAFYALNSDALSEQMKNNPEELKKLYSDVINSTSKLAIPTAVDSALFSLSNNNIAIISIKNPVLLIDTFKQIIEASGKFSPYLFSAISDENISALFAQDPKIILYTYLEITKASNPEAAAFFILALKKQRLFELFKRDPEKLVKSFTDPAKACSPNSAAIFYLLNKEKIAYLLEMNPEKLISSINGFIEAAGRGAGAAVPLIFDERVEERFINDAAALGESFNSLFIAAREDASRAISLLGRGEMLGMFLENPERVISLFSSIAKVSGEYTDAAFDLLVNPQMNAMLVKDPDGMVKRLSAILGSSGDTAPIILGFLGKDGVAKRFEQDPDSMIDLISIIGKTAPGSKKGVFAMFANPKFVQGFAEKPDEVMENLKKIADSAGIYSVDIFTLLSRERFAQTITELVSWENLATGLTNLVTSSGKDAPLVLHLFENEKFTKQFINDPYRELQIVSHLRSFTGNDLTKGLEVLNDPEIEPVFAEDPSVLVTTRFRAYMDNATAIPGMNTSDALEVVLKDKKIKKLFIDYIRQEFHEEGDPYILVDILLPELRAYQEKRQKN